MQLDLYQDAVKEKTTTFEYFVLLSPSYRVKELVAQKKHLLHKEIGISKENLYSIAHVSLIKFAFPVNEGFLFSRMARAIEHLSPFKLEIKGLTTYDHGFKKSIVLKFKDDSKVKELHKNILHTLGFRPFSFDPHLTIARSVPTEDIQKITKLQDYAVEGDFTCDKISILKKPLGSKQRYEIVAEIKLKGQYKEAFEIIS